MILDILVATLVIGTMARGYRQGFLENAINSCGWIIGLVVGFVLSPLFKVFLMDNTQLDEVIYASVSEKAQEMFNPIQLEAGVPDILKDSFSELAQSLTGTATDSLASSLSIFAMSVLSFVILTIACNLVFKLTLSMGSKKKRRNIVGTMDGIAGLAFGFVKGIIYVFILLALLFPIATMAKPETYAMLMDSLYESNIALELYDNNLLMVIIRDLI